MKKCFNSQGQEGSCSFLLLWLRLAILKCPSHLILGFCSDFLFKNCFECLSFLAQSYFEGLTSSLVNLDKFSIRGLSVTCSYSEASVLITMEVSLHIWDKGGSSKKQKHIISLHPSSTQAACDRIANILFLHSEKQRRLGVQDYIRCVLH